MIDVATIQKNFNEFTKQVIIAPRKGDSVNLDGCPRGTMEVHSFGSVKAAAEFMNVSESTVRRQLKHAEEADDYEHFDRLFEELEEYAQQETAIENESMA